MRKLLISTAVLASIAGTASAETIAVSMARFDDNFLTVLRNGLVEYAGTLDGVKVQVEDAQNDVAKQLDQINNFVASNVDAIIVNPVDTSATQAMSDAAAAAGVPLVYVNREPVNVDSLPDNQAFVASDERESGTLETKEVCRLFKEAGKTEANVYVIMGELSNQAAQQRTQDILDVIGGNECGVKINIIDKQTSNWMREEAQNLMTNWLSTGTAFDGVIANNDESAIGAIQAMKAAGLDMRHDRRRRRRRDPGRAAGDAGWRPRRQRLPGRGRTGQGIARRRAEARQGRGRGTEGLHPVPAGDARQHRRLHGQELTKPRRTVPARRAGPDPAARQAGSTGERRMGNAGRWHRQTMVSAA